jgi:uncharacterized repeat protein (TIGR04076 family)
MNPDAAVQSKSIVLRSLCNSCLFHRQAGETFPMSSLTPQGMCARAFHTGYPHYLSLMYDGLKAKSRSGVTFRCAGPHCRAIWLVRTIPHWFSPLLKLGQVLARALGRAFDFPDRVMVLRLLSLEGNCPASHKPGAEFRSDLFRVALKKGDFCPQSFYTIYPFLAPEGAGLRTPWNDRGAGGRVVCPANLQQATYAVHPGAPS